MILVRKLEAKDIFDIEKRPETLGAMRDISMSDAERIASLPWSYSIYSEDEDRLIGVGGVTPRWQGRAEAWAILAPRVRKFIPHITRVVNAVLNDCEINRIEIAVRCDFPEGHEWASALGFKAEAECLAAYDSEGNDCSMYARVKEIKPRKVK